jgi:hypothetical protein
VALFVLLSLADLDFVDLVFFTVIFLEETVFLGEATFLVTAFFILVFFLTF